MSQWESPLKTKSGGASPAGLRGRSPGGLREHSSDYVPLRLRFFLSGEKGFEPLTFGFGNHCSTIGTILLCPFRLEVRTSLFHGDNTGSIPVRGSTVQMDT